MVGSPGFHPGHDAIVVNKLIGAGIVGFRYRLFYLLHLPLVIFQE